MDLFRVLNFFRQTFGKHNPINKNLLKILEKIKKELTNKFKIDRKYIKTVMGKRRNMLVLLILFTLLICLCMKSVSTTPSAPSKINESSSRRRSEPNVLAPINRDSSAAVTDASDIQANLPNGEDPDPVTQRRRNKIREVSFVIVNI